MKEPPKQTSEGINKMKTIVKCIETIGRTLLPSSIPRGFYMVCRNFDSTESMTDTKYGIWPSVAISRNYISPALVDEDFFYLVAIQ
jgi:hypothetical protein